MVACVCVGAFAMGYRYGFLPALIYTVTIYAICYCIINHP